MSLRVDKWGYCYIEATEMMMKDLAKQGVGDALDRAR